jgi:hypothetical protein
MTRHSHLDQVLAPFSANSSGPRRARTSLLLGSPIRLFDALVVYRRVGERDQANVVDLESFASQLGANAADVARCQQVLQGSGSDKGGRHNYHFLYAALIKLMPDASAILEVGLGTNHRDTVSNMGASGVPGASLRAFRELFPRAHILGADVDRRILFQEDRITTFWVDQTDLTSVDALAKELPPLDIVIDDGLHSPDANVAVAAIALARLRPGGWLIIEDIAEQSLVVWDVLMDLLERDFKCTMLRGRAAYVLVAVRR